MLSTTLGVWELYTANRNINLSKHYGNVYEGSSNKLKIEPLYNPALLVVGINLYNSSEHTNYSTIHYSHQQMDKENVVYTYYTTEFYSVI